MSYAELEEKNQALSEERRKKNLEIARRVAAGELRPVVISFSKKMREELRLPKRAKHTRFFVEMEALQVFPSFSAAKSIQRRRPGTKCTAVAVDLTVCAHAIAISGPDLASHPPSLLIGCSKPSLMRSCRSSRPEIH